jgi:hypothetical protein
MTDEQKPETPNWVKSPEPQPEIYSNFFHVSWTLFDVRIQLGQLVPSEPGQSKSFVVEEQAAVTVAWPQAKNLRDMLIALVENYENTNGEIKQLKITPAPTPPSGASARSSEE